ncbi:hypothetical protein BGX27_006697 [Mortierella sp. AM989]|nr:hypothetical protein BGX27_006697 [Mortierella sp. AM989]
MSNRQRPLFMPNISTSSGSSSPSPFHSSFGPTPTAATVTPAAASGTTAAPASSTASASTTANMFGTTNPFSPTAVTPTSTATTTVVTGATPATTIPAIAPPFGQPAPTLSIFGTASSTTATTFTSTTTPGIGTTPGIFGSTITNPHVFGVTTPLFSAPRTEDMSDPKATNSVPIDVIRSIRFRFQWPHADVTRDKIYSQSYKSKVDGCQFRCVVKMVENCFLFQILCHSEKDFANMQWVTAGIIQSPDKLLEISNVASPWPMSRMISISGPVLSNRFSLNNGEYAVEITLSNNSAYVPSPIANSQLTNDQHCDTILGRMLRDSSTYDVFFEFESPDKEPNFDCEPIEGEEKSFVDIKKEEATELGVQNKKEDEVKDSILSSLLDDKKTDSEHKTEETSATTIWDKVGAHKVVLSQFEYFKNMFSSSFAEGGPGVKTIKIRDTDVQCFRLLIEYLYLGRLGLFSIPRTLTEDEAKDSLPTWEDVYLIADRYNVVDLRRMAATRILSGLSTSWAIPFLFRTAYLFDDLRSSVVKFIVQNNMAEVTGKDSLAKYYDHPECSSILTDLLAVLWKIKLTSSAPATLAPSRSKKI